MAKIAIIDYKLGNLFSVQQACRQIGLTAEVTSDHKVIQAADALILPGVGAFKTAMKNMEEKGFVDLVKSEVKKGKPFLGICLGMQLLFSKSYEFGEHAGLGLIEGEIVRFKDGSIDKKIPHVGWNTILKPAGRDWQNSLYKNIPDKTHVYFVHSYYAKPKKNDVILSETDYFGEKFCSSLQFDNIVATQYHPEKSGPIGIQMYDNWKRQFLE